MLTSEKSLNLLFQGDEKDRHHFFENGLNVVLHGLGLSLLEIISHLTIYYVCIS